MKIIGSSIFVITVVACAWGYYYYQELYIPSTYAAAAVPLYQTIPRAITLLRSSSLSDEMDFGKAGNMLHEQCDTLHSTQQQLAEIRPSMHTEAVHRYFHETLDLLESACDKALLKVENTGALMTFLTEFEKIFTLEENSNRASGQADDPAVPVIRTIGDLQRIWGGQMKAADEAGKRAFGNNFTGVDEKTADILTKEWQRIQPNLTVMISVLKNLTASPLLPVEKVEQHIAPLQLQAAEKAIRELEKSRDVLRDIYKQPEFSISALDIVNFRSLEGVSQVEISEHLYALTRAIQELETRY